MPAQVFSVLVMFLFVGLSYISSGQSNTSPFEPYDCRFYMAEVAVPVEPIPQAVLDAIKIPDEIIPDQTKPEIDPAEQWRNWSTIANFSFGMDRGNMPMITDLNSLHPYFRDKVYQLLQLCESEGITLAIVEAYRTPSKQHEYQTMGKKYTRSGAGKSKHQYGMAIDVVPVVDSVAQWNNIALWRKVGAMGEKLGLRWGGRWRHPFDPGHFEWTGGLTAVELGAGKLPIIPNEKNRYPCIEEDLELLRMYWSRWTTEQSLSAHYKDVNASVPPSSQ